MRCHGVIPNSLVRSQEESYQYQQSRKRAEEVAYEVTPLPSTQHIYLRAVTSRLSNLDQIPPYMISGVITAFNLEPFQFLYLGKVRIHNAVVIQQFVYINRRSHSKHHEPLQQV